MLTVPFHYYPEAVHVQYYLSSPSFVNLTAGLLMELKRARRAPKPKVSTFVSSWVQRVLSCMPA